MPENPNRNNLLVEMRSHVRREKFKSIGAFLVGAALSTLAIADKESVLINCVGVFGFVLGGFGLLNWLSIGPVNQGTIELLDKDK